jgi:hypothetical protein
MDNPEWPSNRRFAKERKNLPLSKNTFAVHDFTYKPLNFWKNMLVVHDFREKTSNFVTIHLKTLVSTNFYAWACKLLKKIATHNSQKKTLKLLYDPPVDPTLFFKKNPSTSHKLTKHPPLHAAHCRKEVVVESVDTGLARQGRVPFSGYY